jgi:hypothetical protein
MQIRQGPQPASVTHVEQSPAQRPPAARKGPIEAKLGVGSQSVDAKVSAHIFSQHLVGDKVSEHTSGHVSLSRSTIRGNWHQPIPSAPIKKPQGEQGVSA